MDVATPEDAREVRYRRLVELGIALSAERSHPRLMEMILLAAKELTNADGGALYLMSEDRRELRFAIVRIERLGIALGGTTGAAIPYAPIPMREPEGVCHRQHVAVAAAITGKIIAIADADPAIDGFDASGPGALDDGCHYRARSNLTVPLINHAAEVVGVLQLMDARRPDGAIVPFPGELVPAIEALASQAAVAIDNERLIAAQRDLFRAVLQVFANAIDAKSPYTGGHCRRVPELTDMLARAACAVKDGPLADFNLSEEEWYALEVAGGLHDCGKITTREFVVDKATKLETVYDRIHEIAVRFEVVKRDVEIEYWKAVAAGGDSAALAARRDRCLAALDADFAFVARCNIGSESLSPDDIARLEAIAATPWLRTVDDSQGISWEEARRRPCRGPLPMTERLIADQPWHIVPHHTPPLGPDHDRGFKLAPPALTFNHGELHNLKVTRGTLTEEERHHINDHIVQTIMMLESLPFPRSLRHVPEWAGSHHERMDGTGYPRGLMGHEMSIPARIMAIADIFEALTARDRPYKTPKKLSECIAIMAQMSEEGHIDPDLFELFLSAGVARRYAEAFLLPEQIDDIDIARYVRVSEPVPG